MNKHKHQAPRLLELLQHCSLKTTQCNKTDILSFLLKEQCLYIHLSPLILRWDGLKAREESCSPGVIRSGRRNVAPRTSQSRGDNYTSYPQALTNAPSALATQLLRSLHLTLTISHSSLSNHREREHNSGPSVKYSAS